MGLFLDNFLSLPPLPAAFPGPLEVKCYLEESESERDGGSKMPLLPTGGNKRKILGEVHRGDLLLANCVVN